jgi:polyhydroxyalkanoate synthesis repressor PhaR
VVPGPAGRESDAARRAELEAVRGSYSMAAAKPSPEDRPDPATTVAITRYPNRRLYDRTQGRYVTLQEIAELVRQGKTVAVRDSKTGEDLTRSILTQIILEHHPERMDLLPIAVLNCMIRANGTTLMFLRDYFRQALAYLELLQRSAPVNPFALPMAWMRTLLPGGPAGADSAGPAPDATVDAAALTRRVADLERRLAELHATGQSRPRRASPAKTRRRGPRSPQTPEAAR